MDVKALILARTGKLDSINSSASASTTSSKSSTSISRTADTQGIETSLTSAELREEIEELQKERSRDLRKMELIEQKIEELAQEARDNIIEAAKKQQQAIEEHEDQAKETLDSEIKKYIEANKEGGNGMTKAQLQSNIKSAMPNAPKLAEALALLTEANSEIAQIDSMLGSLNLIIGDVKLLDADIQIKTSQYDSVLKAEEAAKSKSCDPIGFTLDSEAGKVRYDFIVDDGNFDSTNDFLGSQAQWAEMKALDTSGDGVVKADELSANSIKAVKTNPDGSQEIVDIAKELGSDFSIDLSSYKTGGSHGSINSTADSDADGVLDQQLLGTFNVNVNGSEIKGYNTLDDVDFLEENYGVSADSQTVEISSDLESHVNFFTDFSAQNAQLKNDLFTEYSKLNLSEEFIKTIDKESQVEASNQANIFMEEMEAQIKAEEEQKAKEIQQAKESEEVLEEWSDKPTFEDLNVSEDCELMKDIEDFVGSDVNVQRVDINNEQYYKLNGVYYNMDGEKIDETELIS